MSEDSVFSKCMLLVLEQRSAGQDRKIRKDRLEIVKDEGEDDAQDKAWGATKRIFNACPEFIAIGQLDRQVRGHLEALDLPARFQRGTFAIPFGLVKQAQQIVDDYIAQRQVLIDAFLDGYAGKVLAQKAALGALFDAADYPSEAEMRAKFSVQHKWLSLGVPPQLADIDPGLYQFQLDAQRKAMEESMEEVRHGLRAALKGLVDHLLNRLSQRNDKGKCLRLHDSAVDNIVQFLDLLPAKNITGDLELQRLAERARAVVTSVDIDTLKTPGASRAIFERQLGDVNRALDQLVVEAPVRKFGGFAAAAGEDAA